MVVFKQVNFVFPNIFSMNDYLGRLSEFFNEIHQLMIIVCTLEGGGATENFRIMTSHRGAGHGYPTDASKNLHS